MVFLLDTNKRLKYWEAPHGIPMVRSSVDQQTAGLVPYPAILGGLKMSVSYYSVKTLRKAVHVVIDVG